MPSKCRSSFWLPVLLLLRIIPDSASGFSQYVNSRVTSPGPPLGRFSVGIGRGRKYAEIIKSRSINNGIDARPRLGSDVGEALTNTDAEIAAIDAKIWALQQQRFALHDRRQSLVTERPAGTATVTGMEEEEDVLPRNLQKPLPTYFGRSFWSVVRDRSLWLVTLLMMQSISSVVLSRYEALLQRHITIALFLTMLTGTAGNAGNQSSSAIIRAIAEKEFSSDSEEQTDAVEAEDGQRKIRVIHNIRRRLGKEPWQRRRRRRLRVGALRRRAVGRELRGALVSGGLLAVASFARVYATRGATTMTALAVALAMFFTVLGAVLLGTTVPFLLDAMGVDPTSGASPALATLTDIAGIFVLCGLSSLLLH